MTVQTAKSTQQVNKYLILSFKKQVAQGDRELTYFFLEEMKTEHRWLNDVTYTW